MKSTHISRQVSARGISDQRILEALQKVKRESFLPASLQEMAYEDLQLPAGENIYLPRMFVVARWLQLLDVEEGNKILLAGFDSGYLLSILAHLGKEIYAIDDRSEYLEFAQNVLKAQGLENVHFHIGPLEEGWKDHAPYDRIFVAQELTQIPPELINQLKNGGKAVMPVGPDWSQIYLEVIEKDAEGRVNKKMISDSYFIPKPQLMPYVSEKKVSEAETTDAVKKVLIPFEDIESMPVEDILERIGDARVVLFGEASHGTSEFYRTRQRISKALISKKGFNIIGAEADWPDMEMVNQYVQGRANELLRMPFKRFPHWMWRNAEFLEFTEWLKKYNENHDRKANLYGLDLYGLENSIHHVLEYLEKKDPQLAAEARAHYSCISPYMEEPSMYGQLVLSGKLESCEQEVMQMLLRLLKEREKFGKDKEAFYYVYQNARAIVDAERYYKIMYYGGADSWNLRDLHMFNSLRSLLAFHGPDSKAIVWAHNSHIGNALATQLYARGEINIGHLCKESYGDQAYNIGFGTHTGTVAAADNWGGPMKIKKVNPSLPESYEHVMHQTRVPNFKLPLRANKENKDFMEKLSYPRLERAIGVIYRPDTERQSHYFLAALPSQFDELIWFDESKAVKALAGTPEIKELPALHPFARVDE